MYDARCEILFTVNTLHVINCVKLKVNTKEIISFFFFCLNYVTIDNGILNLVFLYV